MGNSSSNVTAVVLTYNEEANLKRCLASLEWCSDILVVDSGSTDRTAEIARGAGARFRVHVQTPPFRIDLQRNWALDHGEIISPWVLFLDADEVIPSELARRLDNICSSVENPFDAYELTPRYIFWGTWLTRTQGFPNWHARLVRLGKARFVGGVWEHFETNGKIGRIDIPYDHYANSKGLSDWLTRHDRYSSWDAEHILAFLESGDARALGTERKLGLRRWAARFWPLRPLGRFIQMYFLRAGFLEGRTALVFCLLYFFYEFMIVVKVVEGLRRKRNLPL